MKISIIQVPYDSGQFNRRMGRGPSHLIDQGLLNWLKSDGHEAHLTEVRLSEEFMPEVAASLCIRNQIKHIVEVNRQDGYFPLILAGNCNYAAFGTIAALQTVKTGILWLDAHGDFNTPETSASGFFDGMSLSFLTGNGWSAVRKSLTGFNPIPEEQVLLIGARDLDAEEALLLKNSNVVRLDVDDFRTNSMAAISDAFFQPLAKRTEQIYLHIDLDVLDDSVLKVNHYAVSHGLKLNELIEIVSAAKEIFEIAAAALTAYDPGCDQDQRANHVVRAVLKALTEDKESIVV